MRVDPVSVTELNLQWADNWLWRAR